MWNPFEGWLKNTGVDVKMSMHRQKFTTRDLFVRAKKMFVEEAELDKDESEIKNAIKAHIASKLEKGEINEIKHMHDFIENINHSLIDLIAISHFGMRALRELIQEDENLRRVYPKAEVFEAKLEQEYKELGKTLSDAGNAFTNQG